MYLNPDARLQFTPAANYYGPASSLTAHVADATTSAANGVYIAGAASLIDSRSPYSQATVTLTLNVTPVNDAPVPTAPLLVGFDINENNVGAAYPVPSQTIEALFGPTFSDPNDANFGDGSELDTFLGVMITKDLLPTAGGTWQYNLTGNPGDWQDMPSDLALDNGLYLPKEALVRFKGDIYWNGHPALEALLVETGSQAWIGGARPDLSGGSATGGTTQVSDKSAPVTLQVHVVDLNSDPAFTAPGPIAATEDQAQVITGFHFTDNDGGDTFTVTLHANHGTLSFGAFAGVSVISGNGTGTIVLQGSAVDLNAAIAANQLSYTGNSDFNGTDHVSVDVMDQGSLAPDGISYVDRKSAPSQTVVLNVAPVNDAPESLAPTVNLPEQVPDQSSSGLTVNSVFGSVFSDRRDQVGGNPGNDFTGVFITDSLADPITEGEWQYFDGTDWKLLAPSVNAAVYLDKATLIRFQSVQGYIGQPGGLSARLTETSGNTGTETLLPALTSGQAYDLGAVITSGGQSHVSAGDVMAVVTVSVPIVPPTLAPTSGGHICGQNDHPSEHEDPYGRLQARQVWTPGVREGLDMPDRRSALTPETGIIVEMHVVRAAVHSADDTSQSMSRCLNGICQLPGQPIGSSILRTLAQEWTLAGGNDNTLILDRSQFSRYLSGTLLFHARLADGRELPDWLEFDPRTLVLTVRDPNMLDQDLHIDIIASDPTGRSMLHSLRLLVQPDDQDETQEGKRKEGDQNSQNQNGQSQGAGTDERANGELISQQRDAWMASAIHSFEALWTPGQTPVGADGAAGAADGEALLPCDADLDHKIHSCSMDALLMEARTLMSALAFDPV